MDLEILIKSFKVEEDASPDLLLELIQQIETFFAGNLDVTKLDSYLGLTFPESDSEGIYGFLRRKITDKSFDKVKERSFNLIQFILLQKNWTKDVERFCYHFKGIANMYWKQGKESARLQQAALDCLISLFENFGDALDKAELAMPELFWELLPRSEKSSFQPTVRAKMFHLMGIIGALGVDGFMKDDCVRKLFEHMTRTIKAQVDSTDSHFEASILLGCMTGLRHLIGVYGPTLNFQDTQWITFQNHLERIVNPSLSLGKGTGQAKIKRREFQRASLELVANQGEYFKHSLLKGYKQWFEDLFSWSKSTNADDNKVGRRAMYKFLEIVVAYAQKAQGEGRNVHNLNLSAFCKFFAERFKSVLVSKEATRIEISIAVRGYGLLATLPSEDNQSLEMLQLMIEHVNKILQELDSTEVNKYSPVLSVLPTYLESVANILSSLKVMEMDVEGDDQQSKLVEEHLDSMKKLAVSIIRNFPEMSESQRNYCHISVQKIFDSLWFHHHSLCEPYIEQVYHQSFLHIVSCPTRAEIDILVESWKKTNPYSRKSALNQLRLRPVVFYVKFFKNLLHRGRNECDKLKFDLLMKWMLNTISKLDLSINFDVPETADEANLDLMQGATASVEKDFQIFVNIVDFFQEFMSSERSLHQQFEKWIPIFADEMLAYIKANPFVSGFYKILAVLFDASRSVKYFEQDNARSQKDLQKRLNVFLRHLGAKIREYRDDLLFAVLELWLSLPDTIVLANFTALNQTLQTVFTTGKSCFSLAVRGLEAIERWFFQPGFPVDEIKIIMNNLYPILKTYFMYSENISEKIAEAPKSSSAKERGLKSFIKKKTQSSHSQSVDDPTLHITQMKILQLLGSFGQYLDISDQLHTELYKDQRFLLYGIPFQDYKPKLFIDDLLPRVMELSENAVERQTRISACEFLHTTCLLFIGQTRGGERERLFKQLFDKMLILGCDSDITVRQLFNPLCLQTIHWFTKQKYSPYVSVMLGSMTGVLAQRDDSSLREHGALCFGEYFTWSLKYSGSGRDVLKTIFAMSTHASPDYRQGSVLAFNSIYREFREEEKLVNEFAFNLLYSFLIGLKLSKDLPEDSLLIKNTIQSIQHLERILKKKKAWFNTAMRSRQFKPASIDKIDNPVLKNVVDWLLTQGGDEVPVYREECLRLIDELSKCVDDYKTPERCLLAWEEKNGLAGWISLAEQSLERGACHIAFLDASSSFYNFLFENEVLNRRFFETERSQFCDILTNICSQPPGEMSDEDKITLIKIFCRLKFVWMVLDDATLSRIWNYALVLSKSINNLLGESTLLSLGKVISYGMAQKSLNIDGTSLLVFTPTQDLQSARDQLPLLLCEAIWYRTMADQELMTKMVPSSDLEQLKEHLWTSINTALFKQTNSSAGPAWEANVLNIHERRILENYLITALFIGLAESDVVEAAFDATAVMCKDGSYHYETTKGHVFQKQMMSALVYCDSFFNFSDLLRENRIVDVGDLILGLLELFKSARAIKKKFGDKIFSKTVDNWKVISINCDISVMFKIFAGLITIDLDGCKKSVVLSNWWNGRLQARELTLKQKAKLFGFINVFSMSRNKKIIEALIGSVSNLIQNDLNPQEIGWAEAEQSVSYIIRKLLKTLELMSSSQSPIALLESLICAVHKIHTWTGNETESTLFRTTRETLEKVVKLQQTDGDRKEMASKIYEVITHPSATNKKYMESSKVWKYCLLSVVSSLNLNATKKFFEKFIYDIFKKMEQKSTCLYDFNVKILAVSLLELMVYQTNSDFIKGKELATAYWKNASSEENASSQNSEDAKSRIVYKSIVRVCLNGILKDRAATSYEDVSMQKSAVTFSEACYNTLVATLLVTNAEFRFCQQFLFPSKKTFENIVDSKVTFEFPLVIDEEAHKAGVISFRKRNTNAPAHSKSNDSLSMEDTSRNFMFGSQNLSDSSLAPEAACYDFTTSGTLADSEFYQRIFGNMQPEVGGMRGENGMQEIRLEWNEVNQHGCMYAYVEALKRMAELHQQNKDEDQKWLKVLTDTLIDSSVSKGVKIFIVGGIINAPEQLEPFAAELTEPILQLLVDDTFGSLRLNHFVQDVLLTLLSWHKNSQFAPASATVTKLLKYILSSIGNEEISSRKDITKYVLGILQNITESWIKDIATIPSKAILSLGEVANPIDERSLLMLDVCLHILQGGQLPHAEVNEIMRVFKKALASRYKSVYRTAAKCIGLILKKMKNEAPEEVTEQNISSIVGKIMGFRTKPSNFIELIAGIQLHFPEIMVRVREGIFELCKKPKLRVELLALLPLLLKQALSETRSNADTFMDDGSCPERKCGDEFFIDVDGRGFFQTPCKTDEELSAGLSLFDLFITYTSGRLKLLKVVDWVKLAETSTKQDIRLKFATCLHRLYKEIVKDDGTMDTTKRQLFLHIFIRMLEDETVQEVVKQFWADVLKDWSETSEVLLETFNLVGLLKNPMNVCLEVILQRCCISSEYGDNVFTEPLEDITFLPFQLDTSWRFRNSSFQPLFAESLSSMKNFNTLPRPLQSTLLSQRRSVGKFGMNVFRATLENLQFTPTVERGVADDSIHGSMMLDRINEYDAFQFPSSMSSLSFGDDDTSAEGMNGNLDNLSSVVYNSTVSNPILKLRRKFYARKDDAFFAARSTEKKDKIQEETIESEKARVSGVKTVRTYRIGELPDIQIKHSDVINSLLKLAKLDHTIGQQFLAHLYDGFIQRMNEKNTSKNYLAKSKETFERLLQNSADSLDRPFSTLLLELCINHAISIPVSVTLDVCKFTNSQKLGILRLEDELSNEIDPNGSSSSKRPRLTKRRTTKEEEIWLSLAELYKEIDEFDALRNIFVNAHENSKHNKEGAYQKIGDALHSEGLGLLEPALELYEEALQKQSENEDDTLITSKMFLEDSMMQCISKLGNWSLLYERTERFCPVMADEDYIRDKNVVERLIPTRMLAGMQLTLRQNEDERDMENLTKFQNFMENYLMIEEGTNFFSENYPFHLGMWLLVHDETEHFSKVSVMIDRGYEYILRRMKNINRTPVKEQNYIIVSLQQAATISNYMKWKRKADKEPETLIESTNTFISEWRKHLLFRPLGLLGNDLIASYRDCLASKVGIFLQEQESPEEILRTVQEFRVEQDLWLTDLGIIGKNCAFAHNCLIRIKSAGLEELKSVDFRKSMAKFLSAFSKEMEREEWVKRWCVVWKKLDKCDEHEEIFTIKVDLLNSLTEVAQIWEDEAGGTVNLSRVIRALKGEASSTVSTCLLSATEELMRTCDPEKTQSNNPALYAKLFLLLKKLASSFTSPSSISKLSEQMLCCVIRGSTGGSASDMLLLSNVFSLLKSFPETLNAIFNDMANLVPSFMFLPWIDQIMTTYKSAPEIYSSFKPLIQHLAADYPQAFHLQYPEYLNESYQTFTQALKALVLPTKLHENRVSEIVKCKSMENMQGYLTNFETFLKEVINSIKLYGDWHTDYATKMVEIVSNCIAQCQATNDNPQNLLQKVQRNVFAVADRLSKDEKMKLERRKNVINLFDLSPFLAQFHFFDFAHVEKPGLYENFKKPKTEDHPLIVSFHPTGRVFNTLTRPINFTLITNYGKSTNYLAKIGDDLRQDRRVQQLFKMSNVLFDCDGVIKQRNFNIQTYPCIPLTPDFGLIEMVVNTMSMVDIIFDTSDLRQVRGNLMQDYDKWILQTCHPSLAKNRNSPVYNLMCQSSAKLTNRNQAEDFFNQMTSKFPSSTLRDNIRKRSKDLYEFFSIRQCMIKSYGALCMVHWMLGIGDRHLENTLLSLTSGKIVGIDFGRAFGTSNYVIPLPELVPFRLTPQFQQLMMPYTYKGLFRESCILTWNCLMAAKETILTVSDVFIKEPSMDWLKLRQGSKTVQARESNEETESSNINEETSNNDDPFPFKIMRKKILGYNPTKLLLEELKMHYQKEVSTIYSSIAENDRMFFDKEKLSTEEYVDVLLDLASDKNILIRIFRGWNAWI